MKRNWTTRNSILIKGGTMDYLHFLLKDYRQMSIRQLVERYERAQDMNNTRTTVSSDMKTAIKYVLRNKSTIERKLFVRLLQKKGITYYNKEA